MLHSVTYGKHGGLPLIIAHGLFGSGRNWRSVAKALAEKRKVVVVDMRNHGESPWFGSHDYPDMAGDLAEIITVFGGQADVMGHSMGGKAAMVLALTRPELVKNLIVLDISPVSYGHGGAHRGLIDAMQSIDVNYISSRGAADRGLATAIPDPANRAFLLQSLDIANKKWRLNLPVLAAEMDKIVGWQGVTGSFPGPVLLLRGALSDYVQTRYLSEITRLFPAAEVREIAGAGHWLHVDNPTEVIDSIAEFLRTPA